MARPPPARPTRFARIASGRGGGTWTVTYLTSTAANAVHATALGYTEASTYKSIYGSNMLFAGQSIDDTAVLVKYMLTGDANFNG